MTNRSNPRQHVQAPDVSNNPYIYPALLPPPPPPRGADAGGRTSLGGQYILMPQVPTYALGVEALGAACIAAGTSPHPRFTLDNGDPIFRPLTFRETLEARVNDYNTLHTPEGRERTTVERLQLFQHWDDTATGIGYQKKSTKFKIIPQCAPLITIDPTFNQEFMATAYGSLTGVELDRSASRVKYDELLEKTEVLNHPAWRAAVEDDASLLRAYTEIVFAERNDASKLMGFYILNKPAKDQLRALFVGNLIYGSVAYGSNGLYGGGSFLRVAPRP